MNTPDARNVLARYKRAMDKALPPEIERDIAVVSQHLKGSTLAKFTASVEVVRESLRQGGWVPRENAKALSGLAQNFVRGKQREGIRFNGVPLDDIPHSDPSRSAKWDIERGITGGFYHGAWPVPDEFLPQVPGVSEAFIRAQLATGKYFRDLVKQLDHLRPAPVKTSIGLSPKVTRTLTGLNLKIDLSTVDVVTESETYVDEKTGEKRERVKWPHGTKLNMTPYPFSRTCEACGKWIPSGIFVPLTMRCAEHGLIGMLVGQDCARAIFGVRYVGLKI